MSRRHQMTIPTEIVPSQKRQSQTARQVESEFQRLVEDETPIKIAGLAKSDPQLLLQSGLKPKHKLQLFDTEFFMTNVRQMPELRFFVAYVVQPNWKFHRRTIYPRIFYKDLSLAWRSASHFSYADGEIWVGKGDVVEFEENGEALVASNEATTDLPLEIQTALESLLKWTRRPKSGEGILELVLRQSNEDRVEPYQDFLELRQQAVQNPANRINEGNPIAWFSRENDPGSLRFASGFQPDFANGVIEKSTSRSRLYGGILERFRVLSKNRSVQFYFFGGGRHAWLLPPQSLTTQLSSYGVRTINVEIDDNVVIPGFEYHHFEDSPNGPVLYSQIPPGFAGDFCGEDDAKADASPWLGKLPVIKEFRRKLIGK